MGAVLGWFYLMSAFAIGGTLAMFWFMLLVGVCKAPFKWYSKKMTKMSREVAEELLEEEDEE